MNKLFKQWLITTSSSFAVGAIVSVVFLNCSIATGVVTTSCLSIGYGWALINNRNKLKN